MAAQQKNCCNNDYYLKLDEKNRLDLGPNFNNQRLTQREVDVLKQVILGYSAKKIALHLQISFRTVETYIEILKLKLGCCKKAEIIEKSIKLGLIDLFNLN